MSRERSTPELKQQELTVDNGDGRAGAQLESTVERGLEIGGAGRSQTGDISLARRVLCQLSYSPESGALGRNRTFDLRFRKSPFLSAELQGQMVAATRVELVTFRV